MIEMSGAKNDGHATFGENTRHRPDLMGVQPDIQHRCGQSLCFGDPFGLAEFSCRSDNLGTSSPEDVAETNGQQGVVLDDQYPLAMQNIVAHVVPARYSSAMADLEPNLMR
jgi:hypothetical protein